MAQSMPHEVYICQYMYAHSLFRHAQASDTPLFVVLAIGSAPRQATSSSIRTAAARNTTRPHNPRYTAPRCNARGGAPRPSFPPVALATTSQQKTRPHTGILSAGGEQVYSGVARSNAQAFGRGLGSRHTAARVTQRACHERPPFSAPEAHRTVAWGDRREPQVIRLQQKEPWNGRRKPRGVRLPPPLPGLVGGFVLPQGVALGYSIVGPSGRNHVRQSLIQPRGRWHANRFLL